MTQQQYRVKVAEATGDGSGKHRNKLALDVGLCPLSQPSNPIFNDIHSSADHLKPLLAGLDLTADVSHSM